MLQCPGEIIANGSVTGLYEFGPYDYGFDESNQIELGKTVGIRVTGAGQVYHSLRNAEEKRTTRLVWTGAQDGNIFSGKVRHGVFEDFAIVDGKFEIPSSGGTGFCEFNRVSALGVYSGFRFGSFDGNENAADNIFRNCQFVNCERPIFLSDSQQVNFAILDSKFYRTDCCVRLRGGGLVDVVRPYLTDVESVFIVRGPGSRTGAGNGRFSAMDVKYDAQSTARPNIVRDSSTATGSSRVLSVNDVHWPGGAIDGGDLVVSDSAIWTIENSATGT